MSKAAQNVLEILGAKKIKKCSKLHSLKIKIDFIFFTNFFLNQNVKKRKTATDNPNLRSLDE
jgi:hypothetical protein